MVLEGDEVAVYGWGGRRVAVPRAEIGRLGAYSDIERGPRGGRWTYSSALILDTEDRTLVRLTGHWNPAQAAHFARGIGVPTLTGLYLPPEIRRQLRKRAPGYRKVRARSRLISLWYALLCLWFFIAPIILDVLLGERWGTVGAIGGLAAGYLACYVIAVWVPRWTRKFVGIWQ
jgi:hypothetical protein